MCQTTALCWSGFNCSSYVSYRWVTEVWVAREVWRCRWNSTLTYVRRKIRRLLKLVHTADTDKTKLSCRVLSVSAVWTKLATRQDSFVLPRPNFQFQMFSLKYIKDHWKLGNCKLGRDKIKLSCLVCRCVHNADMDKTRQSCLVRVGGVNKLLEWT